MQSEKISWKKSDGVHFVVRGGKYYMGFYANDCRTNIKSRQGEWERVAFVYNRPSEKMKVYVLRSDATLEEKTCAGREPLHSNRKLVIGQWNNGNTWNGDM